MVRSLLGRPNLHRIIVSVNIISIYQHDLLFIRDTHPQLTSLSILLPFRMKEPVHTKHISPIPGFRTLRRVPVPYRSILPLELMKRYQCLVVGAANGTLTVAISDQRGKPVLELLKVVTGCAIFPVWVHPARMQLLLHRLERYEHSRIRISRRFYIPTRYKFEAHSMLMMLRHLRGSGS